MTSQTEKEIIRQWQDPEEVERSGKKKEVVLRVVRPFYLKTVKGPAISVQPGKLVALCEPYLISAVFFCGKAEPLNIPESSEYLVRRTFNIVNESGEYQKIMVGSVLRLSREEAIDFMKKQRVKPLDENIFYTN